jgi:hypothetical protein
VPSKTLLIIASARDETARQLATLWADAGARLLLPRDLSRPGWRYQPGQVEKSIAIASGESIAAQQISGVLTRVGSITEDELIEIAPEDRPYVAQEMTAFLVAWLSTLTCPVLNRPGTVCLSGPNWRPEQWVYAAAQAGVPVVPARRRVPYDSSQSATAQNMLPVVITVVGKKCFGPKDRFLHESARRIARYAHVELLAVTFAGRGKDARFASANLWPNIFNLDTSNLDFADAVRDHLAGGARRHS